VNYRQRRQSYRAIDEDGIVRTRNLLLRFDRDFACVARHEVTLDEAPLRPTRVRGLEDCRLATVGGRIMMTCATTDRHPSGRLHQSLCVVEEGGRVAHHVPLVGAFDGAVQKNWLPFAGPDGALLAIYGYDPARVLRVDVASGRYDVETECGADLRTSVWRGSAGPIVWRADRRLVLVHEVVPRQGPDGGWERVYLHRFVEYDSAMRLRRYSRPFVFAHKGVEFACGMAPAHGDEAVVVSVGLEDSQAYLVRLAAARGDAQLSAEARA
jgi:hypothetical protein